jgi:hypothetical protein
MGAEEEAAGSSDGGEDSEGFGTASVSDPVPSVAADSDRAGTGIAAISTHASAIA